MGTTDRATTASPALVALLGWILPGAGYLLLGQRGRAMGVGIPIIVLFVMGLLIGGVRVIEVPGYDVNTGDPVMVSIMVQGTDGRGQPVLVPARQPGTNLPMRRWVMQVTPLDEIREKPWSVPQVLAGPIAIAAGAWSVHAASDIPGTEKTDPSTGNSTPHSGIPIGAQTHARLNEISSLYLSVAGLLNLMAIIDSAWRASHLKQPEGKETVA